MSNNGEDIIRETFEKLGDAIGVQMQIPDAMITNLGAVLQAQIDLLAELQSTSRLVPAGGMALTAEQVEDVEALVATANPYSAPAARLRALFPATEPAAERCDAVSIYGDRCFKTFGHDDDHKAFNYTWDSTYPAPAEPAEEETKAEGHDPDALAKRLAWIWHDGWDACGERERGYLRRAAEMAHSHYASSPVVPAPTETSAIGHAAVALRAALDVVDPLEDGDWEHAWRTVEDLEDCASRAEAIATTETGPWQTWEAVPEGVTVKSANGERFRKTGVGAIHLLTNGVGDCCQVDTEANPVPAPFFAVKEES